MPDDSVVVEEEAEEVLTPVWPAAWSSDVAVESVVALAAVLSATLSVVMAAPLSLPETTLSPSVCASMFEDARANTTAMAMSWNFILSGWMDRWIEP